MYEFEKNELKAHVGRLYKGLKEYNCIVAGGMITSLFCNREINDVDIYFRNTKDLKGFIIDYVVDNSSMWIVAKTKKALLIRHGEIDIQLICFDTFENPKAIFNTFDFTVCMGAYDFKTEEFILHDDFLRHNAQRILMFNQNTAYPIASALRVDKYKSKGYTISKTEYLRVVLTCMEMKIDNYEDLKDQLGGMYGVDYDEIIKPLEGEVFNLLDVITKMSEIVLHPDYFKNKTCNGVEIENWNLLIAEMTGEKIPCYPFKEELYIYSTEEGFEKLSTKAKEMYNHLLDQQPLEKFFPNGLYVYKNVRMDNEKRLLSHYKSEFEYKIGEYAIAQGKGWYNKEIGIFVLPLEEVENHSYYNRKDNVVIELKLDNVDDFINLGEFTIRKALVTRIMP